MDTVMQVILIGGFALLLARWILVHKQFERLLREERPDLYQEHGKSGLFYMGGRAWIDFALRRGYRGIGSEALDRAGDALVRAYDRHYLVGALFFFIGWVLVSFAILFIGLW